MAQSTATIHGHTTFGNKVVSWGSYYLRGAAGINCRQHINTGLARTYILCPFPNYKAGTSATVAIDMFSKSCYEYMRSSTSTVYGSYYPLSGAATVSREWEWGSTVTIHGSVGTKGRWFAIGDRWRGKSGQPNLI